jgi:hypothetical protein
VFAWSATSPGFRRGVSLINANGEVVAKPNYHQARKQRELARKARQQEKQQRRSARQGARPEDESAPAAEEPALPPSSSGDPT